MANAKQKIRFTIRERIVAISSVIIAFLGGIYLNTVYTPKIAVVNIDEVVAKSPMLKEARLENEKKMQELSDWVDKINKDIEAENDQEKHNKLADQYINLTREKEAFIKMEYNKKIREIDETITALIDKVAKENGCNVVLPTTAIVSGGKNITEEVLKVLK